MSMGAEVGGAATLAATLSEAGHALGDLDGFLDRAGDTVLGAVHAPRDTGALDRSLTSAAGVVSASARHAPFVHYGTRHMRGRPFLTDALAARVGAITDDALTHLTATIATIRGD